MNETLQKRVFIISLVCNVRIPEISLPHACHQIVYLFHYIPFPYIEHYLMRVFVLDECASFFKNSILPTMAMRIYITLRARLMFYVSLTFQEIFFMWQ